MLVKPVQPEKDQSSMLVPLVIFTAKELDCACCATVLAFVVEPVMLIRLAQPEKASAPTLVTLSGTVILNILFWSLNAAVSIEVTNLSEILFGIVI